MTVVVAALLAASLAGADGPAFGPGETLEYDVRWFGIRAGTSSLSVLGPETVDGQACLHLVARAHSDLVFFFTVDDRVESWSTADGLQPVRFEKHLREGRYRKDQVARFDRPGRIARWGSATAFLEADCRDLLGSFYQFRRLALPAVGGETRVCVHTERANYPLAVRVLKRERISVAAGRFDTVLIQPRMRFEGLFRQRGDMLIWLTDDAARVPVLVKAKVFLLGSVSVALRKMTRP